MNLLHNFFIASIFQDFDNPMDENKDLAISPIIIELKKDIKKLEEKLAKLILNLDELELVICKNIQNEYWLKFGELEKLAYEKECIALRLKRKIELIQRCINLQEPIDLLEIEEKLDIEFEEYQLKLQDYIYNINLAKELSKLDRLSLDETKKLKSLYLKIIKIIHPDLNKNFSMTDKILFQRAIEAYKNGDLIGLETIDLILSSKDYIVPIENSIELLNSKKSKLLSQINKIKEKINNIKNEYPYKFKFILESVSRTKERELQLAEVIAHFSEAENIYNTVLKNMIGEQQ